MRIARRLLAAAMCALAALAMCVGLAGTAWGESTTGSITIKNAQSADSYSLYKILNLSYSEDASRNKAFAYTAESGWGTFLDTAKVSDASNAETYFTSVEGPTTGNGSDAVTVKYYQWNPGVDQSAENVQAFAQKALAFAKNSDNGISKVGVAGTANADNTSVTFSGLDLGYYLIDSSLGAVCVLDTIQTDIEIYDKNGAPTVLKEVQENSKETSQADDYGWGATNDAAYGDTVNFRITVSATNVLAQGYTLTDTMGAGLKLDEDSIKVTYGGDTLTTGNNGGYELVNTGNQGFTIKFNASFDDIVSNDEPDATYTDKTFVVTYTATVTNDADLTKKFTDRTNISFDNAATENDKANLNTASLYWSKTGDDSKREVASSQTWTNVHQMSVFKYTGANMALKGAKFELRTSATDSKTALKFTEDSEGTYSVSKDAAVTNVELVSPGNGIITLKGLDGSAYTADKVYYLVETEAPAGYNALKDPIKVTISPEGKVSYNDKGADNNQVPVENNTGTELPSTGGMGTTVIYVAGGLLVAAAVVLLVAKKKMSANDK